MERYSQHCKLIDANGTPYLATARPSDSDATVVARASAFYETPLTLVSRESWLDDTRTAAATLGRQGGARATETQKAAARANGRKGGRPRVIDPEVATLQEQAKALDTAITAAVRADYPDLCGFALRVPGPYRWDARADHGDGGWRAWRSQRERKAALRRYLDRAVSVAAGRISECYGIGLGSAWAARHFGATPAGVETAATAQGRHASGRGWLTE